MRAMKRTLLALVSVVALAAACQRADENKNKAGGSSTSGSVDLDSKDILGRTEKSVEVDVKHVLIGWSELAEAYGGHIDPRAAKRSQADAAKLATEILGKLQKDPQQIDALVKQHSEDPGSLRGDPYTVREDAPFVPEFKNLARHPRPSRRQGDRAGAAHPHRLEGRAAGASQPGPARRGP
jgi:hypothetical protein